MLMFFLQTIAGPVIVGKTSGGYCVTDNVVASDKQYGLSVNCCFTEIKYGSVDPHVIETLLPFAVDGVPPVIVHT